LINGMPACTAGAMGYSVHIPQGLPVPPTMLNMGYWRRYLVNIPKALVLVALTLMANLAIAGISSLFVSPTSATGKFVKDVTGVDTSSWQGVWTTIKSSFTSCSDLPIVPNAVTVGFSNVMVGVSIAAMVRALAVHAAQGAVSMAVKKGLDKATEPKPDKKGQEDCGCT
jgi:hypothetical protein